MDGSVGCAWRLPVRSVAPPRRRVLNRHASPDGQRIAACRPRVLVHAHRRHRPFPAHARQGGLLSDGMGRQRPADRAPRAELFRRALRSVTAVRSVLQSAGEARKAGHPGFASELHRSVRAADGGRREGLRGALAPSRAVGGLVDDVCDDRSALAANLAGVIPAAPSTRPRLSARSADTVGRGLQDRGGAGGARGSRATGRVPQNSLPARRPADSGAAGVAVDRPHTSRSTRRAPS